MNIVQRLHSRQDSLECFPGTVSEVEQALTSLDQSQVRPTPFAAAIVGDADILAGAYETGSIRPLYDPAFYSPSSELIGLHRGHEYVGRLTAKTLIRVDRLGDPENRTNAQRVLYAVRWGRKLPMQPFFIEGTEIPYTKMAVAEALFRAYNALTEDQEELANFWQRREATVRDYFEVPGRASELIIRDMRDLVGSALRSEASHHRRDELPTTHDTEQHESPKPTRPFLTYPRQTSPRGY